MSDERNTRREFVRAAMAAPYLSREEEYDLAVAWREDGDQPAMHRLASAHMRLVVAIAARFRKFGLSMGDLIQEGHVGLLEAAGRFEPERQVRFSTYATWWIRASIQDYVLRNWSIVRGGTSSVQKALFFNLRRSLAQSAKLGIELSTATQFASIAKAIGVSASDVELMTHRLSGPDKSLNVSVRENEGGNTSRQDFLVCGAPLPDETVGEKIDGGRRSVWLKAALKVLNERELRILRERRLSEEGATLESLGRKMGISKERVRQIESRAIEKLRTVLTRDHPDMAPSA